MAEIRRGKKEQEQEERKKKPQDENIMACPIHREAIKCTS